MILSVTAIDACSVGDQTGYSIVLQEATLYTAPADATYPFTVYITCVTTSFDIAPSPFDHSYTIGETDSNINLFGILHSPIHCFCATDVVYTVSYNNGSPCPQPSFILGDPATENIFNF